MKLISRTIGIDRVVDEMFVSFRHTQEIPCKPSLDAILILYANFGATKLPYQRDVPEICLLHSLNVLWIALLTSDRI